MDFTHVEGSDRGKVRLYALSTCGWCKRTKALLQELGVGYDYIDVDLLKGSEQTAAIGELQKFNPGCSFPTLVINDSKSIAGFKEDEIREALV